MEAHDQSQSDNSDEIMNFVCKLELIYAFNDLCKDENDKMYTVYNVDPD